MSTRHGEYKVPGGKLVVVDLQEHDGRLAHVQVAGDFFLEPDSALDDIRPTAAHAAHLGMGHHGRGTGCIPVGAQ